jgi:hypothetical protein
MRVAALALLMLLSADPAVPVSDRRLSLSLGFSHWFGDTFGTPLGISTPALELSARPGLSWLEIHLRYALSIPPQPVGAGFARVGFVSLGLAVSKEARLEGQHLEVFAGLEGLLIHAGSAGGGVGVCFGAQWLFDIPVRLPHAFGPYVETRGFFYVLPNDTRGFFSDPRRDAQIDVGVMTTLF